VQLAEILRGTGFGIGKTKKNVFSSKTVFKDWSSKMEIKSALLDMEHLAK
jgi:hypothetical protein